MAVKIKKGKALDNINFTPMIDMVFNLLIFFMVTSKFSEEDKALEMPLPSASDAKPMIVKPREMFINVDKDGRCYVGHKFVTHEELEAILRQAAADNPTSQAVMVRAHKKVEYEHVVQVINLCKRASITNFQIATADN